MPKPSVKTQVLDLLREVHATQTAFVNELSAAERNAAGAIDKWEAKDIIAHTIFWQECAAARLDAVAKGETPPSFDDWARLNDENFEARRHRSWSEVIDDLNRVSDRLLAQVQGFSESDLTDPKRYTWLNGRRLWQTIIGTAYSHPIFHLADYHMKHGNLQRAIDLQELTAQKTSDIEGADGEPLYNLACFYALGGEREKALKLLPDALRLSPSLVEWSQEDSNLASLHGNPAYEALYAAKAE